MKGLEFYSAAAQIIPVLLILLAVETRPFTPGLSKLAYWIVLLAFAGETCALIALYTEDPPRVFFASVVSLVLIALGVLVFLAIVLAPSGAGLSMRPTGKDESPTRRDEDE